MDRDVLSVRNFMLSPDKSGIIAEIKKKSPSKGVTNDQVTIEEVAQGYEEAGVSAISVLTDHKYFGGSNRYLSRARSTVNVPILRKDFMVDEYQFVEAKSIGADFVLLIAAALEPEKLKRFAKLAKSLGLGVLMEVHNKEELDRSLCDELDLVGVNNRNLKTFDVSVDLSKELAEHIPGDFVKVSESGISDPSVIKDLKTYGYQGFLIGENFMKQPNPGEACKTFIDQLR